MRKYEVVLVFKTQEELYKQGLQKVKDLFNEQKANILKDEDLGERQLAYLVKKEPRGRYQFFEAELDPESIVVLERAFRLRDDILKFLFVKKEK